MSTYIEESRLIMGLLAETGAAIERMSIDEAYLELTDALGLTADNCDQAAIDDWLLQTLPVARQIKQRIRDERQLTASIGIAANKFLAKLGSDFCKPDGLTLVPERDKVLFLRPLPIGVIHGVGRVTEQTLHHAGLETIGDLQDYAGDLRGLVGSFALRLRQFAFGIDDRPLELGDEVKSISSEETFDRDTDERPLLRKCLRELASDVATRLQRRNLAAHTVQVKIRYGDFTTLTRQITLEEAITDAGEIYRLSCHLLAREKLVHRPLRLLGLGVSGLRERVYQQMMFSLFP